MFGLGMFLVASQAFAWTASDYQNSGYFGYANGGIYAPDYNNYNDGYIGGPTSCVQALTSTLSTGQESDEVLTLQDYLHDAGYLSVMPNGYFGASTRQAVVAFQRDHGISATGSVGSATRSALNDAICGSGSTATVAQTTIIPTTYVNSGSSYSNNYSTYNNNTYAPAPTYGVVDTQPQTFPYSPSAPIVVTPATPVTPNIGSNGIAYYPYDPYHNTPVPLPSSLIISSPSRGTVFNEGDNVTVSWNVTNAQVLQYRIELGNSNGSNSRPVMTVPASQTTASFTLSKDLLDYLCIVGCQSMAQNNFSIIVVAILADPNGSQITTTLKGDVTPIFINRPFAYAGVKLTINDTPVTSGKNVKLLVSTPLGASWNSGLYGPFTITLHAVCPNGVQVTINGTPCGQDYTLSQTSQYFTPEISAYVTNATWVPQLASINLTVTDPRTGQVIGTDSENIIIQRGF
jgi:hypothetical protein